MLTIESLRRLFEAAKAYKKLKPWEFMFEDELFAIKDPATGTLGYCSVTGTLGEHLTLSVYLGEEGLSSFMRLAHTDFSHPYYMSTEVLQQRALVCSFENLDFLQPEDRHRLDVLGMRFRGEHAWPVCHEYSPGFPPSPIQECWKVDFLAYALEQATTFCKLVGRGKLTMHSFRENSSIYLLAPNDTSRGYVLESMTLPFTSPLSPTPVLFSQDLTIQKLKKLPVEKVTIACDTFLIPYIDETEDGKPFYPSSLLGVNIKTGEAYMSEVADLLPSPEDFNLRNIELLSSLSAHLLTTGKKPQSIQVSSDHSFALLEDFCQKVGIRLIRKNVPPLLLDLLEELDRHFLLMDSDPAALEALLSDMLYSDDDDEDWEDEADAFYAPQHPKSLGQHLQAIDHLDQAIQSNTSQILGVMNTTIDAFLTSPLAHEFSPSMHTEIHSSIHTCLDMLLTALNEAPMAWTPNGIRTLFMDIIPAQFSGPLEVSMRMPHNFKQYLIFLGATGFPQSIEPLVRAINQCEDRAKVRMQDKSLWGPAKTFAMAALEDGIDFADETAVHRYMASYNKKATTPAPFLHRVDRPAPSLPFLSGLPLKKVGRNEPCPCGSGKKYKQCCGRN